MHYMGIFLSTKHRNTSVVIAKQGSVVLVNLSLSADLCESKGLNSVSKIYHVKNENSVWSKCLIIS